MFELRGCGVGHKCDAFCEVGYFLRDESFQATIHLLVVGSSVV